MARRLSPSRGLWPGLVGGLWIIRLYAAGANDPSIVSAVLQRDAAVVQQLLKAGADVNGARGDGLTALHAAAAEGDVPIAQMLIVAGANIIAATALTGSTPLHLAAKNGQAAVVELLLKSGADPNRLDTLGTTPLMLAAASGNATAVTALLDAGADPNAKEPVRDETALMFAAADGRTDAVAVLLGRGADWRPTTKVFDWTKLRKTDPRLASGDAHPVKRVKGAAGRRPRRQTISKRPSRAGPPAPIPTVARTRPPLTSRLDRRATSSSSARRAA